MRRGIGACGCAIATLVAAALISKPVIAEPPSTPQVQAVERFRAAAVLQQRALYDLAVAEYAEIERAAVADPIADRARLQRGVCQFHLKHYEDAAEALKPLQSKLDRLTPTEAEQSLAYLGLAEYNLSHAADDREQLLDFAVEALAEQLQRFPTGELASLSAYYHAEALYARGRLDEAAAAYRALLATYPAHEHRADALYALGVTEQERRDFSAAVAALAALEQEYPQHAVAADARHRRGESLLASAESQFAREDDVAAERALAELLRSFPESALVPPALMLRAQIELKRSALEAAEATLDECIARSTHAEVSGQARLLRAQVRYRRENFGGTLADTESVLASEKQKSDALHLRGLAESKLGRPLDAIQTFTQLLAIAPKYPRADHVMYDLAWAHQAANQPEQAIAAFARLATTYPQSAYASECQFRVGEAKYGAKDFVAAAECFTKACDANPSPELLSRALHKFAWCSFERGDCAAAEAGFARQLAAQQGQVDLLAADALYMIVECRFQQRQYEQTLAAFDAALPHQPADKNLCAMTFVHAAQAAAQIHHWQRSFELADRAAKEFSSSQWQHEARCDRGVALVELGRLDEAERELTEIATEQHGLVQLKSELALAKIARARKDRDAAARAYFKVAYGHGGPTAPAAYHPLQAEAIFAAAEILEETGRNEAAAKLYQELVDHYPASEHSQLARQSLERTLRR